MDTKSWQFEPDWVEKLFAKHNNNNKNNNNNNNNNKVKSKP
jgi:hypothetical protein